MTGGGGGGDGPEPSGGGSGSADGEAGRGLEKRRDGKFWFGKWTMHENGQIGIG